MEAGEHGQVEGRSMNGPSDIPLAVGHTDVDAFIMAMMANMPVLIWNARGGAYCLPEAGGLTVDRDVAGRWTLADAYFSIDGSHDAPLHVYIPVDYITLDVPMPPSTNNLFKNAGKRRIKTGAYAAWQEHALIAMKPQLRAHGAPAARQTPIFDKHWAMWIRVNIDHGSDITNRIKAIEDLFVSWGLTCGDQWNDRCLVERDRTLPVECRVIIYRKVQS